MEELAELSEADQWARGGEVVRSVSVLFLFW